MASRQVSSRKGKAAKAPRPAGVLFWPMVLGGLILHMGIGLLRGQFTDGSTMRESSPTGFAISIMYLLIGAAFTSIGGVMLYKWVADGHLTDALRRSMFVLFILLLLVFGGNGFWILVLSVFGMIVVNFVKDIANVNKS